MAINRLNDLHDQVLRDVILLFDDEIQPIQQIRMLQHAFLDTSTAIAKIRDLPIDLSSGRLRGFDLARRNFEKGNLENISLVRSELFKINLQGAFLRKAVLRRANLRLAQLSKSDLEDANFECADLHEADLIGAKDIPYKLMGMTNWREAQLDKQDKLALDKLFPVPEGTSDQREKECQEPKNCGS